MRLQAAFLIAFSLSVTVSAVPRLHEHPGQHDEYHYAVVHLHADVPFYHDHLQEPFHSSARQVESQAGWELVGQVGDLNGHYLYRMSRSPKNAPIATNQDTTMTATGSAAARNALAQLDKHPHVKWVQMQTPSLKMKKRAPVSLEDQDRIIRDLGIQDPGFHKQWHLLNHKKFQNDINVTGVWAQGITGKGVVSAVIDDGVDLTHEDIRANFYLNSSYDFNAHVREPQPRLRADYHGTRCAGEIAAVKNGYCGVGVAYESKVAGIRILGGLITDVDEALALNYGYQENDIYSCSWGPEDDGKHVEGPNALVTNAIVNGAFKGRGGKGSIFVFATGNGGYYGDNCNYDGYTNSIYTITIGAIDHNNQHPPYSEKCSAHLASTYSSGSGSAIYTTDVQPRNCTSNHGGTSAAAPIAVGMLALALSVRPELTWRDMQHLTIRGAVPITTDDSDWQKTHTGRMYSHKFGYGKLDAWRLVEETKHWTLVGPQTNFSTEMVIPNAPIPNGDEGLRSVIEVTADMVKQARMKRVEHVLIHVNITHDRRGDLDIWLISPHDIKSHIGPRRSADKSTDGFKYWTFLSVKHWEEDPVGNWTLHVTDTVHEDESGTLQNWRMSFLGEADGPTGEVQTPSDDAPVGLPDASNTGEPDMKQGSTSEEESTDEPDGDAKSTGFSFGQLIIMGALGTGLLVSGYSVLKIVKHVRDGFKPMADMEPVEMGVLVDPTELEATFVLTDTESDDGNGEYLFDANPKYDRGSPQ